MTSRFYLCSWEGDGSQETPYVPAVAGFWNDWRAIDGREDPALPGGEALVEAFDVHSTVHDQMIAPGEITEITPANIQSEFSTRYSAACRDLAEAKEFFDERRGTDNPAFKAVVTRSSQTNRN